MTAVTGLPERVSDLLLCGWRRGQQFLDARLDAQRRSLPQPVNSGASLDQQTRDPPAPVSHRVIERAATAIDAPGASISAPPSISAVATSTSSLLADQGNGVSACHIPSAGASGLAHARRGQGRIVP